MRNHRRAGNLLAVIGLVALLATATAQRSPTFWGARVECDDTRTVFLTLDAGGVVSAPGIDLTCAPLGGIDLADAGLRGAKLAKADLSSAILDYADLSCAVAFAANLAGTSLRGANLDHAILTGATLTGANLRGATLRGAVLTGADLRGADLIGADLTESWFDDATIWPEGFDPIAAGSSRIEERRGDTD